MPKYELLVSEFSGEEFIKRTDEDGTVWFIPTDPTNSDYQTYLDSLKDAAK
jgi:hypothetical protein